MEMLEIRLIGTFSIQRDGKPIIISSRGAQSLFAYLILNTGTSYRREKLAGMFWPDVAEEKARAYLRHELWRIRKALSPQPNVDYLLSDDISVSFDSSTEYWLDVTTLTKVSESASVEDLIYALSVFRGEFLPGFYDEWVILEREHLQVVYEQNIARLLKLLESEKRWQELLEWAECWISLGQAPEPAYRALMVAYDALGDRAKVAATYERCVQALRGMALEPSEETRALAFKRTSKLSIPIPLTSFIGRELELKDVVDLLSKSRLVTLTGSGGVGKTRLSIEVASEVLNKFPEGVWFLDLAPLNDPTLMPNKLLALLGVRESGELSVSDLLINYFRFRTAFVIFDNCEHLIEACAQLINLLLISCRNLSVLATSREGLRVSGEIPYRVPSLETPQTDVELDITELSNMESVKLFTERAAMTSPGFVLSPKNGSAIAQICQRLDGIPLAIELAAACTNVLTVEQISNRLDDRFNLLTQGLRSSLPRHQTLRATIDWSYELLSEKEQILFRRLAVFMGGWTLESAQEICTGSGIESNNVLDLLSHLVNKSLVVTETPSKSESLRYRMLETIRQYALEKLTKSREKKSVFTHHLEYFLKLAELAEPKLYGAEQMEWMQMLRNEHENIRAALEWADHANVEAGLLLSGSLHRFWESFGLLEDNYWLQKFLQKPESHNYQRARIKALCMYGWSLVFLQRFDGARSLAEECLGLYRSLGDRQGQVDSLLLLAWISATTAQKKKFSRQAFKLAQSIGDVRRQSSALWQLGWLYQGKNGLVYWEKAIALTRSLGNWRGLAGSLSTTGFFLVLNGDIESAQKYLDESNRLYQQLNLNPPPTHLLSAYGQIALIRGDFKKARAYLQESVRINIEFGSRQGYLWARARLGYVALREGNLTEAGLCFVETARSFQEDNYEIGVVYAIEGMAGLSIIVEKFEWAASLIGWSDKTRKKLGDMRPLLEQESIESQLSTITARIGESVFSRKYKMGQKMTLGQAMTLALQAMKPLEQDLKSA